MKSPPDNDKNHVLTDVNFQHQIHTKKYGYKTVSNQIIKCLNQIISGHKPYNLRLYTFTLHKFQEKNLNLNRDSRSEERR